MEETSLLSEADAEASREKFWLGEAVRKFIGCEDRGTVNITFATRA